MLLLLFDSSDTFDPKDGFLTDPGPVDPLTDPLLDPALSGRISTDPATSQNQHNHIYFLNANDRRGCGKRLVIDMRLHPKLIVFYNY